MGGDLGGPCGAISVRWPLAPLTPCMSVRAPVQHRVCTLLTAGLGSSSLGTTVPQATRMPLLGLARPQNSKNLVRRSRTPFAPALMPCLVYRIGRHIDVHTCGRHTEQALTMRVYSACSLHA